MLHQCVSQWIFKSKKLRSFLHYKAQKFSQTPRSSHVLRHIPSPGCPVPIVWKGPFCPGPHMYNCTKPARQRHPRHPTCQKLNCHFPCDLQKCFLLSCTYRKKCLLCNNLLMIAAASIMGCSKIARSFEMILIGRFMCGISAGKWFLPQVSRLSQNFTFLFKVNNNHSFRK